MLLSLLPSSINTPFPTLISPLLSPSPPLTKPTMAPSTPPPIIPTTTQPPQQPPITAVLTTLHTTLYTTLTQCRPWSLLLTPSLFSSPSSFSVAATRIRLNTSFFRTNYLTFILFALAASLITHPFSLLTLLALAASWAFLYLLRPVDQPLILFGRLFSEFETLAMLVGLSVLAVFVTSVGSVLLSALFLGVGVVCVHAAFRVTDDLYLDVEDSNAANAGLLSFLAAAATASGGGSSVPRPRV